MLNWIRSRLAKDAYLLVKYFSGLYPDDRSVASKVSNQGVQGKSDYVMNAAVVLLPPSSPSLLFLDIALTASLLLEAAGNNWLANKDPDEYHTQPLATVIPDTVEQFDETWFEPPLANQIQTRNRGSHWRPRLQTVWKTLQ